MCRIAAYFGNQELLLEELLVKPENSLVKQSHRIRDNGKGLHADGFGVSWYNFALDNEPGIFKSVQPAWNDYNIHHLAKKISSNCMLAHVRSSTVGDVILSNCHPFSHEDYSMIHNGTIRNFDRYKMQLIQEIDQDLFLKVKGNTDTELFFYLIITYLRRCSNLIKAVRMAVDWVVNIQEDEDLSRINIVISNGFELLATRFATKTEPLSLKYRCNESGDYYVASEPLDAEPGLWHELDNNQFLYVNRDDFKHITDELI